MQWLDRIRAAVHRACRQARGARRAGEVRPSERPVGMDRGLYHVPDDFDAPLPEETLAEFES